MPILTTKADSEVVEGPIEKLHQWIAYLWRLVTHIQKLLESISIRMVN